MILLPELSVVRRFKQLDSAVHADAEAGNAQIQHRVHSFQRPDAARSLDLRPALQRFGDHFDGVDIRTLETVDAMLDLGVARFGIGMSSAVELFEAANRR